MAKNKKKTFITPHNAIGDRKDVSGIQLFYWVQPVCLHHNS